MDNTIDYYHQHADRFVQETRSADLLPLQERFLKKLPAGAFILDFGCGSGRDTKDFLDRGYQVEAVDGSKEICRLAGDFTGIPVRQMLHGFYTGSLWAVYREYQRAANRGALDYMRRET